MTFALILPTRNAGAWFDRWCAALDAQHARPAQVLVFDSQSDDGTAQKARARGFDVHDIAACDFNHGGTRNLAAAHVHDGIDIAVFMTQDTLLDGRDALAQLLLPFADTAVAAAYGRQLPHEDANPLAAHARLFNYPDSSAVKSRADIARLGIKAAFLSNAFAAYRLRDFRALGGFPEDVILGEDMHLAARLILADKRIAYCAQACVRHSHNYSLREEMQRYFDIGVFHEQAADVLAPFGRIGGEGRRFVQSEWRYLRMHAPCFLAKAFAFNAAKWLGYRLGKHWQHLPQGLRVRLGMHKRYWQR